MIKVSLIVMLALGLCALMRRRSAALRHVVLYAAFVGAALLPVMETHLPAWDFRTAVAAASAVKVAVEGSQPIQFSGATVSPPSGYKHTFLDVFFRKLDRGLLQSAWLGGTGVGLGMLALGLLRLRWVARRARPVSNRRLLERAASLASRLEISRPVAVLETDHPGLLVTYGVVRPRIVLPSTVANWPDERIDVVLAHELAHIRRGDWVAQILAQIVRAWCWFNPLVWIAARRLRNEAERACDDEVLRLGTPALDYAAHLVEIARTAGGLHSHAIYPAPAMVRRSRLEQRVQALLDRTVQRSSIPMRSRVATAAGLLMAATAIGTFGVSAQSLGRISGSVVEVTGAGVPNASVALQRIEPMSRAGVRLYAQVQTDGSGRYEFARVPPGYYMLRVVADGFVAKDGNISVMAGEAPERTFTLGQNGSEATRLRDAPLELLGSGVEPARPR